MPLPDNSSTFDREVLPDGEPAWDRVIKPQSNLLAIPLNEIWQYRDLLYLFVRRDIVAFYKQTILGPLWFVVQPILTTLIYIVVFQQIAKLSTDDSPATAFYLSGIALWSYFADCFNKTSTVFRDNSTLFGKVYFPRIIVPLSIVFANLTRFCIHFGLFLILVIWHTANGQVVPNRALLLFPIVVVNLALISLSLGMIFSALTTKYRDLVFLLQFGIQLLMYATPVIYPMSQVPSSLAGILAWNPLAPLFEVVRYGFLGSGSFDLGGLAYATIFAFLSLVIATVVFNRVERTFMDTI